MTTTKILNSHLYDLLSDLPNIIELYEHAVTSNNWNDVENYLNELILQDPHQQERIEDKQGQKYYKPFHRVVVAKIMGALKKHLPCKEIPRVNISFTEADECRELMGFEPYGSAQDFLYGFTSERYSKWGISLTGMGFRAACMSGVASAEVWIIDGRYIEPLKNTPDFETEELNGGIAKDFYETASAVTANASPYLLEHICRTTGVDFQELTKFLESRKKTDTNDNKIEKLKNLCMQVIHGDYSSLSKIQAKSLLQSINEGDSPSKIIKEKKGVSQEQIGLKYCEEGKYLQKLFDGARVEHFQSNVKMVKNVLRKNKVEADSIYRILSEKTIIILEAKGKNTISKTQLYQLYETFQLKLPVGWKLEVVALFLTDKENKKAVDLVQIRFDESVIGDIGESLASISIKKHFRWLIRN